MERKHKRMSLDSPLPYGCIDIYDNYIYIYVSIFIRKIGFSKKIKVTVKFDLIN